MMNQTTRIKQLERLLRKSLVWVELNAWKSKKDEAYGYHKEEDEEKKYPSVYLEKEIKKALGLPGNHSEYTGGK